MVEVDMDQCVGCCTCEIICSYHHKHCFSPKFSSVRIHFKENFDIDVLIFETCDCKEPLCAKFCPVNAIKKIK